MLARCNRIKGATQQTFWMSTIHVVNLDWCFCVESMQSLCNSLHKLHTPLQVFKLVQQCVCVTHCVCVTVCVLSIFATEWMMMELELINGEQKLPLLKLWIQWRTCYPVDQSQLLRSASQRHVFTFLARQTSLMMQNVHQICIDVDYAQHRLDAEASIKLHFHRMFCSTPWKEKKTWVIIICQQLYFLENILGKATE